MLLIVNLQLSELLENGIGDLLYTYISPIRLFGPIWTFGEVSSYPSWPRRFPRPIRSNKNQGFGDLLGDLKESE